MSSERDKGHQSALVDFLVDGLRREGTVESEGEFTLDRAQAREKMAQFQLAEPHSYVLELVQAAVLKGATRVEVQVDTNDVELLFDGRPFTQRDCDELYSAVFTRARLCPGTVQIRDHTYPAERRTHLR